MASIKDLKKMCDSTPKCSTCPLYDVNNFICRLGAPHKNCPDNADEIVDKWVAEHPIKTYAMDFFEKYPNASRMQNGKTPNACVKDLYGIASFNCLMDTCENCWNREMEENNNV